MTQLTVPFRGRDCYVEWSHYSANGAIAMRLRDVKTGEPMVTATVCLEPGQPTAPDGQVWLANWSEREGLPSLLRKAGLVGESLATARCGYSTATRHRLRPAAKAELAATYAADPIMAADLAAIKQRSGGAADDTDSQDL